jgi:hypothetical protein
LGLPPEWVSNVEGGRPEDGKFGRFRISDFGMGTGIWGGTWFGRRMHGEKGVVAEGTECFGQKAEVAVPEELVGADGEVCVEEDFQRISEEERQPTPQHPQKLSG